MAKYIKDNNHYFKESGLSVSEFLDENSLKKRQQLRDEMIKARKKGLHAVIRNNKLYVEGKATATRDEMCRNELINTQNEIMLNQNTTYDTGHLDSSYRNEETNNHSFRKHRPTI